MEQFKIDCCRLSIFHGEEWIPSDSYDEVLILLKSLYKDETHFSNALVYFTQIPLAFHYIKEAEKFSSSNEHLLSFNFHKVVIDKLTNFITVEKRFQYSYVTNGEPYDIDFATLTLTYDPFLDKELSVNWEYTMRNYIDMGQSQILEDDSMFVQGETVTHLPSSESDSSIHKDP